MKEWAIVGALACMAVACGGHTVNLGTSDGGAPAGDDASGGAAGEPGAGGDGGATVLASEIQATPTFLVSDGTSLFWLSALGTISSMPVAGGAIQTVYGGPVSRSFLSVDDVTSTSISDKGSRSTVHRSAEEVHPRWSPRPMFKRKSWV
jgi:hypothetical protein